MIVDVDDAAAAAAAIAAASAAVAATNRLLTAKNKSPATPPESDMKVLLSHQILHLN